MMRMSLSLWMILVGFALSARAEDIKFYEDELPADAVEALVDRPEAVIEPNVSFKNRFKLDLGVGYLMDEPFWENSNINLRGFYNFTETRAFGFSYHSFVPGKSTYAKELEQSSSKLDFSRAPALKSAYFGYFQMRPFYGKISFSKAATFNTGLYMMLGLGMVQYGAKSNFAFHAGGGQEFFVSRKFGFGVDLAIQGHMAPDPSSVPIRENDPLPQESDFKTSLRFRTSLSVYGLYIF